jgi:hypothetical protein
LVELKEVGADNSLVTRLSKVEARLDQLAQFIGVRI